MDTHDTPQADSPPTKESSASGRGPRSETPSPQASLTRVLEFVRTVRKVGGNGDVRANDVMREMGITTKATRAWSYTVPAATQFGLVERIGRGEDARLRVTELAKRIVQAVNETERRAAKIEALKNPELYRDLLDKFIDCEVPHKEGLANLLSRDYGILESTAPNAADCFLESLDEAELISADQRVIDFKQSRDQEKPDSPQVKARPVVAAASAPELGAEGVQVIEVPASFVPHHFPLRKDLTIVVPLPLDLTGRDVNRLKAWLQTLTFDENDGG